MTVTKMAAPSTAIHEQLSLAENKTGVSLDARFVFMARQIQLPKRFQISSVNPA